MTLTATGIPKDCYQSFRQQTQALDPPWPPRVVQQAHIVIERALFMFRLTEDQQYTMTVDVSLESPFGFSLSIA